MSVTADLLSSASLLVAVTGVLYSLWYQDVRSAADVEVKSAMPSRGPAKKRVQETKCTRAVPLVAISGALALVLLPSFVDVVVTTLKAVFQGPRSYNAVWACFVVAYGVLIMLVLESARNLGALNKKQRELEKQPEPVG